jgi:PAS domain-containing protein
VAIPAASAVRVGLFDWNVATGALTVDAAVCQIFGLAPDEYDGRAATLAARVHPADLPGFRAAARTAVREGRMLARCLRIPERGGGHRTIELWGRMPDTGADPEAGSHLVGGIFDLGTGMAAVAALERLADGFFALDREGRITYANHRLVRLTQVRRGDLVGRRPWEAVPQLADPVYEDRFRAAQVSQQLVSFLAPAPDPPKRLEFCLRPDAQGVTGWVTPAADSMPVAEGAPTEPVEVPVPAAVHSVPANPASLGALYQVLEMSSALTEAVTAREVCGVVADQLLPAFGGDRVAIYVAREGRVHLLVQRGYRESFLDRFEGLPLQHSWGPVTGALASGAPLFIETPEEFERTYPELRSDSRAFVFLPLIVSRRPVGACVIGFDHPHPFPGEERSLLTALSGLIAQALERAPAV